MMGNMYSASLIFHVEKQRHGIDLVAPPVAIIDGNDGNGDINGNGNALKKLDFIH